MKSLKFILPVLLLTACAHNTPEGPIVTREVREGPVVDAVRGAEVWFAYGAIAGINDTPSSGVGKAHLFENGQFLHTLEVNLPLPEDGYFYEGWLVEEGGKFISTGHAVSRFSDVRHFLTFESDTDYRSYNKVIVTLEPDDGDPAPADHVAEGLLRAVDR